MTIIYLLESHCFFISASRYSDKQTDNTKLQEIYAEISRMEKTRTTVDSFPVYKDLFGKYALAALLCLALELLLSALLRRLP